MEELLWLEGVVSYGVAFDVSNNPKNLQFAMGRFSGLLVAIQIITGLNEDEALEGIYSRYRETTKREPPVDVKGLRRRR